MVRPLRGGGEVKAGPLRKSQIYEHDLSITRNTVRWSEAIGSNGKKWKDRVKRKKKIK